MSNDIVTYLRSLQREPETIFVGFSPVTTIGRVARLDLLRQMFEGNPGRAIIVLEVVSLGKDEFLVCEPDADDTVEYYRVSKREMTGPEAGDDR